MRHVRELVSVTDSLFITILFIIFLASIPESVLGAESETGKNGAAQKGKRDRYAEELYKRDQAIDNLQRRLEKLETEIRELRAGAPAKTVQPVGPTSAPNSAEPKTAVVADSKSQPPAAPATADEKEEEERLAKAALDQVLIQRNAVLLPPWMLEVEPSITYAHSSFDLVNINGVVIISPFLGGIVIGNIGSERIKRDTVISTLAFRLGLPWESQFEARFPYRYDTEHTVIADTLTRTRESTGMGDLEFGFSRQIMHEKGWWPDLVGGLRWRVPTGDTDPPALGLGSHGLQFLLSAVKVRDPVAFFGGVSYTHNLDTEIGGIEFTPGDTIGFNIGMALALSPETSINLQWDQRFTGTTTAEGFEVLGSTQRLGVLQMGVTYAVSKDYFINTSVGIGLTTDTPNVQATIAVPFRIPRFLVKD